MQDTPIERSRLYKAIKEAYSGGVEMTARECAIVLFNKGVIPYPFRQAAAPRITELCKLGWMNVVDSKIDIETKKRVSVYRMVTNGKQEL